MPPARWRNRTPAPDVDSSCAASAQRRRETTPESKGPQTRARTQEKPRNRRASQGLRRGTAGARKQMRIARTSGPQTSPPARRRCLTCTRRHNGGASGAQQKNARAETGNATWTSRTNASWSLRHSAKGGPAQPRARAASPAHNGTTEGRAGRYRRTSAPKRRTPLAHHARTLPGRFATPPKADQRNRAHTLPHLHTGERGARRAVTSPLRQARTSATARLTCTRRRTIIGEKGGAAQSPPATPENGNTTRIEKGGAAQSPPATPEYGSTTRTPPLLLGNAVPRRTRGPKKKRVPRRTTRTHGAPHAPAGS